MNNPRLLHLMHLVSPALPVGAYAYSQGLEYAVDSGWLKDDAAIREWISGILQYSVGQLDLPVLLRFYQAWHTQDHGALNRWNHFVRANRETRELQLEDQQLGAALQRLLISLEVLEQDFALEAPPCFACLFAAAGVHWQIDRAELAQGFAWSWLENQIAAATKIVPLGQTQAQKMLLALMPEIPGVCERAVHLGDEELGVGLPALAMASSRHERQYSRLFRS